VGPINLKRSYRVFDGDTGYAMELAAVVGQGVLEGRWKMLKSGGTAGGPAILLRARYESLQEWSDMRRELLGVPGLADLQINAESAQGADLTLRYPGGAEALASALNGRGLLLESMAGGWVLRSGN
jgi:hypothetical protein